MPLSEAEYIKQRDSVKLAAEEGGLVHPVTVEHRLYDNMPGSDGVQNVLETFNTVVPGMTYRQWLIGMGLQGAIAYHGLRQPNGGGMEDSTVGFTISQIERYADTIIARMQKGPINGV